LFFEVIILSHLLSKFNQEIIHERPLIRIYSVLYAVGVFLGVLGTVLTNERISNISVALFSSQESLTFVSIFAQHFFLFFLLYVLGLTIVGIPVIPLFPIYKGFSIGALLSASIISMGARGLFRGVSIFLVQNLFASILGYFLCVSAARLSISFFEQFKGRSKHSALFGEFLNHTYRFLIITPLLLLISLWQWKIVPIFIKLF
jgi:hypothetical protein